MRYFMNATSVVVAISIFVLSATVTVHAQGFDFSKVEIETEKLAPNFYTLTGSASAAPEYKGPMGGRIGVLVGPDGIFIIDAQVAPVTQKVVAAIRRISPEPLRFLVNTHVHPDHTGGNANFAKMGVLVLAREEVREGMFAPLPAIARDVTAPATDMSRLPVVTYGMGAPLKIRMNGEVIDLIPVRAAHTSGDTMVRLENADIIMTGDFFRSYGYPYFDINHGGTLKGTVEALDVILKHANSNTKLLPGHGRIVEREDVVRCRRMILEVQSKVQQMINEGRTVQEVLAAKVTAHYDAEVPGGLDRALPIGSAETSANRFVNEVYSELTRAQ